jgi:hypothetical protein
MFLTVLAMIDEFSGGGHEVHDAFDTSGGEVDAHGLNVPVPGSHTSNGVYVEPWRLRSLLVVVGRKALRLMA